MAKGVLGPGQADELVLVDFRQQLLADFAIKGRARVVIIPEQERQVEHVDLRHEIAQRAGRGDDEIERVDLKSLDHVAFAAQLSRRGLFAGERAARHLGQRVDEGLCAQTAMRRRRQRIADHDRPLRLGGSGQKARRRDQTQCEMLHIRSP